MTAQPCDVWFYHLERSPLENALPMLLEKTLARGWKALVRTSDQERVDHFDNYLWTYRDDSFLPHGVEGEALAPREPVLLTTSLDNTNQANALFLIDGAPAGSLDGYERCIILFDGRQADAVADARGRWKALKADGHGVSYWREKEDGGWEKQA
jgi:DNA polymerase-3 subunit chi